MSAQRYSPVRLSHLIRHSSVGAIVRGPDFLMAVTDIRQWEGRNGEPGTRTIYYVEQVKAALEIYQELREPPIASISDDRVKGVTIPAVIFPQWMRCNGCGLLHSKPYYSEKFDLPYQCEQCKDRLDQYPWVLAHESGWLGEVPWHYVAHEVNNKAGGGRNSCAPDWKEPYLKLHDVDGIKTIQCTRCNEKASIKVGQPLPFRDNQQPWLRTRPEMGQETEMAQIVEVNDSRVHSAITKTALVIPPESRIQRGSVVDLIYSSQDKRKQLENGGSGFQRKKMLKRLAKELRCTTEDITDAWQDIENGYPLYGMRPTKMSVLESEYSALVEPLPDLQEDEEFVTEHLTKDWEEVVCGSNDTTAAQIKALVNQVVGVSRLKEILVFTGFNRMSSEESALVSPAIEEEAEWLPALELYGEGLFFSLDESVLQRWESDVQVMNRASVAKDRFNEADINLDPEVDVSARFMLLHAIAHKVVKELEKRSGYPAASLKERIYSSNSKEQPMSGILIYVAVPDVVGSLGGLAEQATPVKLLTLLTHVFEDARWCSLDPVCAEHEGQGPSLLNRAACHACELLPETSCFCGNVLLDRVFIKGDSQSGLPCILDMVN